VRINRDGVVVPPSTAANRYPGRTCHWIKGNAQERIPHRWIVADSESDRIPLKDGEQLRLHCVAAARWRDDLPTGEHLERGYWTNAEQFWAWVTEHCWTHGRTVLWFHNAGHDLGQLNAFAILPKMGYELAWCNLDRDVSVITWRGPRGTLVICDTYTWCPSSLDALAGDVGMAKTPLPGKDDPEEVWRARCEADVEITRRVVRALLEYIRDQHLGNWQPSGAGMGMTTWRHRFMTHKVLAHDDADALAAERTAMHTGRAEAWWHGRATGGPFTEWDMHMSYCRIAAECLLPAKLWAHDRRPSRKVHQFGLDHWRTLAKVIVTTSVPVVPARHQGRICWPVGEFETVLWDAELELITETGGSYVVLEQWRYTKKPLLKEWAQWSMEQCDPLRTVVHPIARTWVKHQSRAVIGRFALRTPSWEAFGDNWLGHTGISLMTDASTGETNRMMHVGSQVLIETGRVEANNAVPQITSYVMAVARARLWRATAAAGGAAVLHVDTDSLIAGKAATDALTAAMAAGLPGGWRPKATWRALEVTGPRHYAAPGRKQVPGVPRRAVEQPDGSYVGEVWDSLARSLTEAPDQPGRVRQRTWRPQRVDHRRPYTSDQPGPAEPITLTRQTQET
jgi:hypothetical protein